MQMDDINESMRETPFHENDLIKIMTVDDSKEVHNDKGEDEVQQLTSDLIRKGLQFATSLEQHFLRIDHDRERALKNIF